MSELTNDTGFRLVLVGRLLRSRWPEFLALAVIGGLVGFGASFLLSPGYVSTTQLLLQGDRTQSGLPAETQIATSQVVMDKTAAALGWGVSGTALRSQVSASIDGNVLSISGASTTPERAAQLANAATDQYVAFSSQIVSDASAATATLTQNSQNAIQQRIDAANKQITALQQSPDINQPGAAGDQARSQLDQARSVVADATKEMDQIGNSSQSAALNALLGRATTRVIASAVPPSGPASPTPVELVLGGAVALVALGVLGHLVAVRLNSRLRDPLEVAAALGAPVIGEVEVAAAAAPTSLLRRLLHDDRLWASDSEAVIEDEGSRRTRYLRILRRVEAVTGACPRLVVLVADDDPLAAAVVPELCRAVSTAVPVTVVAGGGRLAEQVEGAVRELGAPNVTCADDNNHVEDGGAVIRLVEIAPDHPIVPDGTPGSGAVLAMAPATRSGWDLSAVAGACSDAGQPLIGVVLAIPRAKAYRATDSGPERVRADAGTALDGSASADPQ